MMWLLVRGVWETLAMTFVSGFFGFVIGLPVGVLLYVTRPGQIIANAKLYRTLGAGEHFPFHSRSLSCWCG
jgi:D-methionine transport system permease protein